MSALHKTVISAAMAIGLVSQSACAGDDHDDDHDHDHETEVISRVDLVFAPVGGGASESFSFSDPDGEGGASGTSDPITLALGTDYTLAIAFLNELAEPVEDITEEIEEEAEDHFVFVLGDAVVGPASSSGDFVVRHAYADLESDYAGNAVGDDLPVGLRNTIEAEAAGTGTFRVVLRHLPELNGSPQKTADLPASLAAGEALPGDVDVDVSFALTVQ